MFEKIELKLAVYACCAVSMRYRETEKRANETALKNQPEAEHVLLGTFPPGKSNMVAMVRNGDFRVIQCITDITWEPSGKVIDIH